MTPMIDDSGSLMNTEPLTAAKDHLGEVLLTLKYIQSVYPCLKEYPAISFRLQDAVDDLKLVLYEMIKVLYED